MAEIDTHSKVTTPRLGPAPARIGVAAASSVVDQPTSATRVPRKLPWFARHVAIWAVGTIMFNYSFFLTGFVPLQVMGVWFPAIYFGLMCHVAAKIWGPPGQSISGKLSLDQDRPVSSVGSSQREILDRSMMGV